MNEWMNNEARDLIKDLSTKASCVCQLIQLFLVSYPLWLWRVYDSLRMVIIWLITALKKKTSSCRIVLLVTRKEYCVLIKYDLTKNPYLAYDRVDKGLCDFFDGDNGRDDSNFLH